MRVVEVGQQYFVTKDTGNLVACREYTLLRDDPASEAKGWIQGNTRIGPVLEVTTSFRHFKDGIEIRIWSVNQDNSQSWVRISYGTIKYVVDSIQDNTEIPADPQEERVPQTSIKVVAARSKAKAKPQPRVLVGTTATIPMHERRWIDIEPSEQNLASYDLSKKVINLLRHNQTLQREDDGAIEFYKIKFYLRNHHSQIQVWSDDRWKACLAAGGGSKRRYQYCSDSERILYLRALQGHSGNNLIDPTLQDNVEIGSGIFHDIYHIGCAFNLHSIINNGLIPVKSSASTHTVEEFVLAEHRDIASFNADNEFNRSTDEENIDFNIPGVPNSTVKRSHGVNVQNLIPKIENHPQRQALQSDLQQHRAFNPFSKESQDVIKAAGNTELCEILDVEPKAQCKACLAYWDAGIVYCTFGHFLRDDTTENKKYIKSVLDLFSIPNFYIRKGRPHGHRYGKKEGAREYHTANQLQKKCRKRDYSNIHDRFIRDTWFRKTMLELDRTEEVIREMDKLANEDHTHIATEEELDVYRGNWWIRSNFVGSDTMPIRHRPDFKKALSTLHRLKKAEDEAYYQNWSQSSSSSWWQWQDSWWHPSSETSPRRWT